MKERDKEDFYSATQASIDSAEKQNEASLFVDSDKMYMITHRIKDQINGFQTNTSDQKQILSREITYDKHLTTGEQAFLTELGYDVKWYHDESPHEWDHWIISW